MQLSEIWLPSANMSVRRNWTTASSKTSESQTARALHSVLWVQILTLHLFGQIGSTYRETNSSLAQSTPGWWASAWCSLCQQRQHFTKSRCCCLDRSMALIIFTVKCLLGIEMLPLPIWGKMTWERGTVSLWSKSLELPQVQIKRLSLPRSCNYYGAESWTKIRLQWKFSLSTFLL